MFYDFNGAISLMVVNLTGYIFKVIINLERQCNDS